MLFVHLPKTAGTSLRVGVAAFLGADRMALDYGPKQKATSKLVRRWLYEERKPGQFRAAFDRKGLKFLSGHIALSDYVGWFDLDNIAVFLREPVQRVISEYQHYVRHYGYGRSIEEFMDTPAFQNKQARALAGIEPADLGVVGITERYEESLQRLNEHFGWEIPSRRENLGRDASLGDYNVTSTLRKRISQANAQDIELYDRACEIFDQPADSPPFSAAPAIGSFRVESGTRIRGWACRIGSEKATSVRIEINGLEIAVLRAHLFRRDVQQRGLKRSGCAGFEFELPQLKNGDEIRCTELDGGTQLNNSPTRFTEADGI